MKVEWYKPGFLKALRNKVGLTRVQLAGLCGFSQDDINNLERGLVRMGADDAVKLYEALASADTTGDAHRAALAAAIAERESIERQLKEAQRELARLEKEVEVRRGWLTEAEANEKRLKAKV